MLCLKVRAASCPVFKFISPKLNALEAFVQTPIEPFEVSHHIKQLKVNES